MCSACETNMLNNSTSDYRNTVLYLHSARYAREHGELEAYRTSYKANIACRDAIAEAVTENYRSNSLNAELTSDQLGQKFSTDRITYVLAATIRQKDWDGRFSSENKAWAKTIPVCRDPDEWSQDRSVYFTVSQVHPGLINLFADHIRKEKSLFKKPSVLAKLKETDRADSHETSLSVKHAKEEER